MVRVFMDGETFTAETGERLSDVLIRAGVEISMPCGGRGTCGKCRVTVDGRQELACRYILSSDVSLELPQQEDVVSPTPVPQTTRRPAQTALALDLGTTTLALALVSAEDGQTVRIVTRTNPQRAFGADVMSRIEYCREHGARLLQSTVVTAIGEMLCELDAPEVQTLYVAGNTTMLHLLFGADPSDMGVFPYTPVFLESRTASGESLGLSGVGSVISLPSASAFVGADLTAGLNEIGLPPQGKYRLLVDLGTNAEVVLFSREAALCTAAAAGPCFEGAGISCGMSASAGAICAYSAEGYRTVGDAPAAGICGTGLVDAIAHLVRNGTIDQTGYMECGTVELAPGVTLTQKDVRQVQLAKSAVCAAIRTLMKKQNVRMDDVDVLYVAGGFSVRIDLDKAAEIGLLPPELRTKCVALGNSSLAGTIRYACEKNDLSPYLDPMRYVDLAADPCFSELFMDNMTF